MTDTPEHLIDKTPTSITYGSGISVPTDAYAVTLNTPTNGFTVAFVPSKLGDVAGKTITISYKAVLQANAAIYGAGNPNTAKLDYTNKIKTDGTPDTTTDHIEDKAVVYTYATKIIKHKDTASGEVMGGIEFQLLPSKEGTAMDVVKVEDGIYRLPVGSETTVKTLVTKSDGSIVIRGLENGTYYLKEIKTISGYNLLSEPIALTVSVTESTSWTTSSDYVNGTLTKRTYSSSTVKFNDLDSVNESTYTTNVINKKGFTLPQTGGLGTLTLSVIGCALVLGGALVLVNSKKRAK